jgi:hypothetical protein
MISGALVGNFQFSVTTHEMGHLLGGPDWKDGSDSDLMFWQNIGSTTCKVGRRDWQLVNPTKGDPLQ